MDWSAIAGDPRHPAYATLRAIVADLRRDHDRWRDKVREYELASAAGPAGGSPDRAATLAAEVQALAVDIESYVAEINYLGVELDVRRLFTWRSCA